SSSAGSHVIGRFPSRNSPTSGARKNSATAGPMRRGNGGTGNKSGVGNANETNAKSHQHQPTGFANPTFPVTRTFRLIRRDRSPLSLNRIRQYIRRRVH